jgi:GWxTD domain-containing protein
MSINERRVSWLAIGSSLLGVLLSATASAETLPELFQKLKTEVSAGSWAEASRTLAALQTEAAKPGNEESRQKLEGPTAFYRGVCEANLGQTGEAIESFATFLKIQPNATIEPAAYSKEVVSAFEEARRVAAARGPSLTAAYREFQPPPDRSGRDAADQFWANGPVQWILTDEEKAAWSRLAEPNARVAFVERFWAARASLPGADNRSYRDEFERRVAFADVYLAHDPETRGSLTDRGMVFVLLGPPTNARRRSLRSAEDPSEPSGESRVESEEVRRAMKRQASAQKAAPGGKPLVSSAEKPLRYQGPEHRAISTDDEYLETWQYTVERLPRGIPYKQVDVHYVTKKGGGKNVLQPDPATRTTVAAAKSAAAPGPAS